MEFPPLYSATSDEVGRDTIQKAVNALLKWKESKQRAYDFIYLHLTLSSIPPRSSNAFRIPFPHPLYDSSSSEFCLIIDDRPNSKLTSDAAVKIIEREKIPIKKVITLSELKTNYQPYNKKRDLCRSYDLFFVDTRIAHLIPKLLGKVFSKRRKLPLPLDMTNKNWKQQVEMACGSGLFYLRSGPSCMMMVAKDSMKTGNIVENVAEAIQGVVQVVPKNWVGVRSLHLRFLSDSSVAVPLYPEGLEIEGFNDDDVGSNAKTAWDSEEEESGDEVEETKDDVVERSKKRKADKGSVLIELNGEKEPKKLTKAEKQRKSKQSLKDGKKNKTSELGKKRKDVLSKAKSKRSKLTA